MKQTNDVSPSKAVASKTVYKALTILKEEKMEVCPEKKFSDFYPEFFAAPIILSQKALAS